MSVTIEGILEKQDSKEVKNVDILQHIIKDGNGELHFIDEATYKIPKRFYGKKIEYESCGNRVIKGTDDIFPLEKIKIYNDKGKCIFDLNSHQHIEEWNNLSEEEKEQRGFINEIKKLKESREKLEKEYQILKSKNQINEKIENEYQYKKKRYGEQIDIQTSALKEVQIKRKNQPLTELSIDKYL